MTGANGFVGRYILRALQHQGIEVVAVGRTPPSDSTPFIEADLLQISDFLPLVQQAKATHLLHLAWYTEHGKFWSSPWNLRWSEATTRLVEAFCLTGGQKVVIAGTCAEYDWTHGYCQESNTPLNPTTLYGTAKDATRRLVMATCEQNEVPCAWGRIFLPYGRGESANRLIPSLIQVFRGERPPFGVNALAYRDFLHVSDVAEGFVCLLKNEVNGAYNICSGEPTRLSKVITTLAPLLHASPVPLLTLSAEMSSEPHILIGENVKLKALGWLPQVTLLQGLKLSIKSDEL